MIELPDKIIFVNKVEIYEAGDVVKLFYRGSPDAMYKYSGAFFGISAQRARQALINGDAKPYNQTTRP